MVSEHENLFGSTIYAYTCSRAIEDGELVDVSDMAKQTGFKVPVAVTSTVWDRYIEWTSDGSDKQTIQDQSGRLWDVLWMLYAACKRSKGESFIHYGLQVIVRDGRSKSPNLIKLKSITSGGDEGEPVITIMLPEED